MAEVVNALAVIAAAVVAVVLLARRPTHPVTVVLVIMTTVAMWQTLEPVLHLEAHESRLGDALWPLSLPMIAPLITVFPDGPRGRFGRALLGYQIVAIAWSVTTDYLGFEIDNEPTWWFRIAQVLLIGLLVSGVLAMLSLGRYLRRSPPESRARIRAVFGVAFVIAALYVVGGITALAFPGRPTALERALDVLTVPLLVGGLPIAIGFSMLSEHPGRVAGAVNIALSWTLRIALAGAAGLVVAQVVAATTGTDAPEPLSVLIPVIVVLVAAPWLARVARRPADMIGGADAAAAAAVRRLSGRLSSAVTVTEIPQLVARTIGELFAVAGVVVEVGAGERAQRAAEWGTPQTVSDPVAVPLVHGGRTVGRVLLTATDARAARAAADAAAEVMPHVAAAVDAAALTLDLEQSHRRVLAVRHEERARLRADLHDELSPGLAGMRLAASTARSRLVNGNAAGADDLIAMIERESATSVDVVRRILEGLRPHALDAAGLDAAIRERAASFHRAGEFEVNVHIDRALGALPPGVDVAVFRTCSEAIANAARHSGGRRCTVRLERSATHELQLEVVDDGAGIPADRHDGIGLASMGGRARAVGGDVRIEPAPGGGTRVSARFPLEAPQDPDPARVVEPAS